MYNTGFPVANFTWDDRSGATGDALFSAQTDGLNVPFGFVLAERGTPGAIYFGGARELNAVLGSETFNESSPYFTPSTRFIATAMAGQGVEVMRLVDPTATTADLGLFLEVTPGDIPQYQKSVTGEYLLDTNGDPKPLLDGSSQPVTEPGLTLRWFARALTSGEVFDDLDVTGSGDVMTYPIMGLKVTSPGSYGNRQGIALYSTKDDLAAVADDIKSIVYRFVPYELPTRVSTTASAIPDRFGSKFSDISFKDVAVYSKTATNYSAMYTLGANYVDANGENSLPYEIKVYGDNVAAVGTAILAVSPELEITDPYMLDLIEGVGLDGLPYDHAKIDATSADFVNSTVVNYAAGGSDGETTFEKLQELIRDWLAGSDHGEFGNVQQHPMTHFSDPGFSMDTKYLLLNMLDLRDNFKIDLSTQDVMLPANTQAQDLSAGQALAFRAQMHQESPINGVGCTRVGIYAHAGHLVNGTPYSGLIPFTLNRLIQRRDLDGGTYIKGSSGGLPNSQVTIFRKPNWVADDIAIRKLAWGSAINVVSHATRTAIFYPSLRTVYPNDTSLLSDDEISDRIMYMFKIARQEWAVFAGVRKPSKKLFPLIQKSIDDRCAEAFNKDGISVVSRVYQTAYDADLGYATSIDLNLSGAFPFRQANFNVIVGRSTE